MITNSHNSLKISFQNNMIVEFKDTNAEDQDVICDKLHNIVDGGITDFTNNNVKVWTDQSKLIHIEVDDICFITTLENLDEAVQKRRVKFDIDHLYGTALENENEIIFDIERLRQNWNKGAKS